MEVLNVPQKDNKLALARKGESTLILNMMRFKLRELLAQLEELEIVKKHQPSLKDILELVEENKLLSKKCKELAVLVKCLKQERLESVKKSHNKVNKRDVETAKQLEMIEGYENRHLELKNQLKRAQEELDESRCNIELLNAQLQIYKEDFELERRDRERAIERINSMEKNSPSHSIPVFPRENVQFLNHHDTPPCRTHVIHFKDPFSPFGDVCDAVRTEESTLLECPILIPRGSSSKRYEQLTRFENLPHDYHNSNLNLEFANDDVFDSITDYNLKSHDHPALSHAYLYGDKTGSSKNKRKFTQQDSFDKVFSEKLPVLE